jgi:MYXO-CTERM domain-containing protein
MITRTVTRTGATGQQGVERAVAVLRVALAVGLVGCAAFLAVDTLHWPLVGDAAVMHYGAFLLGHGFAPYRQIVDINLPGCFPLDWTAIHVFGAGALGWRLFDFALMGAAAAAMFAMARPYGWLGALFAACFLFVLHIHDGVDQAGERDLVLAVFLLVACAAIFYALRRNAWVGSLAFGLIAGAATLIKPNALPWAVGVLVLAAVALHRRRQRMGPHIMGACLGFLAPVATDFLWLWREHAVRAWWLIMTRLIPYHAAIDRHPLGYLLRHLVPSAVFTVIALWLPLAVVSRRWRTWEGAALYYSVAIGIVSFIGQGKNFPYHRYPLEVFLFLLIGLDAAEALRGRGWVRAIAAALLIFAVYGLSPLWAARASRYDWRHDAFTQSLTADLTSLGGPSLSGHIQCLDMYAGCLGTLYRMRLVQSTGFLYDCYFFNQPQSAFTLEMRRRFLEDLERDPPRVIAMSNQNCLGRRLQYFSPAEWPEFSAWLGAHYSLAVQRQPQGMIRWWPVAEEAPGYRIYESVVSDR